MLSGEMNREGTKNTKRLQFSYSKTPIAPRRTSENFGIFDTPQPKGVAIVGS